MNKPDFLIRIWNGALLVSWMGGVVIAEGWMKALAFVLPFYAWYLFMEKIMLACGLISS